MLAVTALIVVRTQNLFAVAMLTGIYSLLSATFFTLLDAVDVAFTEAAVGAGVSTVLMLGTLSLVGHRQKKQRTFQIVPLLIVTVTGLILMYGPLVKQITRYTFTRQPYIIWRSLVTKLGCPT